MNQLDINTILNNIYNNYNYNIVYKQIGNFKTTLSLLRNLKRNIIDEHFEKIIIYPRKLNNSIIIEKIY